MTTTTKRITPDEVVAAYEKTGLKPERGEYVSEDLTYACGLRAYAAANLGVRPDEPIQDALYTAGFSVHYMTGFALGFDGVESAGCPGRFRRGYDDGAAAWEAVSKEVVVERPKSPPTEAAAREAEPGESDRPFRDHVARAAQVALDVAHKADLLDASDQHTAATKGGAR